MANPASSVVTRPPEMTRPRFTGQPPVQPVRAGGFKPMSDRVREARERYLSGQIDLPADETDQFHIDPSEIPDGTTYEWKRHTVYGKEDPVYSIMLQRGEWFPVESSRHPHMMPAGHSGFIERDGMVLMERPQEITAAVRKRERRNALSQVEEKESEVLGASRAALGENADPKARAQIKIRSSSVPQPDLEIPGDD